jgi:hypothetical protein
LRPAFPPAEPSTFRLTAEFSREPLGPECRWLPCPAFGANNFQLLLWSGALGWQERPGQLGKPYGCGSFHDCRLREFVQMDKLHF